MQLFPDAESGEDFTEDFVGGDFAGDGAEGGEGGAEVFGKQVGGDAAVQSVADDGEGFGGRAERPGMASVGDQSAFKSPVPDG